jgi:hypothetical protein
LMTIFFSKLIFLSETQTLSDLLCKLPLCGSADLQWSRASTSDSTSLCIVLDIIY